MKSQHISKKEFDPKVQIGKKLESRKCTKIKASQNINKHNGKNYGASLKLIGSNCTYHSLARAQVPNTPFMLLSIYISIVSCEKEENKQKRPGICPFKNVIENIYF